MIVILQKTNLKETLTMWVITIFEKNTFRMFEYDNKKEAITALAKFKQPKVLSYTN